MDALDVLQRRVSAPRLTQPAPTLAQRDAIFRSALRAADHGRLQPWRYLVIEGDTALARFGELLCQAALVDDPTLSQAAQDAQRRKPFRAPMIVVAIARVVEHPKVPALEQLIAVGAGVQNMLNAAYALGLGAYWRTGAMAYHPHVKLGLGLAQEEQIVGFLYLGTPATPLQAAEPASPGEFFSTWPQQP